MNIVSFPARASAQTLKFKGNLSSDDEMESLERELQGYLKTAPKTKDTFTVSKPTEIKFQFEDRSALMKPELQEAKPGALAPLSPEAAAYIPEIPNTANGQFAQVLVDQFDTLLKQNQKLLNQKNFTEQTKLLNAQRQTDLEKALQTNCTIAKQKIVQLGMGIAGIATFGIIAGSAFATGPLGASGIAMLASTKLSVGASLLAYGTSMFNNITDLIGNKQTIQAAKSIVSDFTNGIKKLFSWGKSLFGISEKSRGIKFQGFTKTETHQEKFLESLEKLQNTYLKASEQFQHDIDRVKNSEQKLEVAQTYQKSILKGSQDFMLESGTEEEKRKIHQVQQFQAHFETLTTALMHTPDQSYGALSKLAKDHLRQMIFDTLTSEVPQLQEWGTQQGKSIGMTEDSINKLLKHN